MLWNYLAIDAFERLVLLRGWTHERYTRWLTRAVVNAVCLALTVWLEFTADRPPAVTAWDCQPVTAEERTHRPLGTAQNRVAACVLGPLKDSSANAG